MPWLNIGERDRQSDEALLSTYRNHVREHHPERSHIDAFSVVKTVEAIPIGLTHQAIQWTPRRPTCLMELTTYTDRCARVRLVIEGTHLGELLLTPNTRQTIHLTLIIQEDQQFYIDYDNMDAAPARLHVMFQGYGTGFGHVYVDPNEIEAYRLLTPEETEARLRLKAEYAAAKLRLKAEYAAERARAELEQNRALQEAWGLLEEHVGSDKATLLRNGQPIEITGSNKEQYRIDSAGNVVNLTRNRRYCIAIQADRKLPLPDQLLVKIKWIQEDADHVERVRNDTGEHSDTEGQRESRWVRWIRNYRTGTDRSVTP